MWTYIARFFVSSISVSGEDKLNEEVLHWLVHHVLPRRQPRILTAQFEQSEASDFGYRALIIDDDMERESERRCPIFYIPAFGRTWFIHDGNVFILRRISHGGVRTDVDYFNKVPSGHEDLVVMCLGRSPEPIKRFFNTCQQFLDDQSKKYVRVHEPGHVRNCIFWKSPELRHMRPLETVHFDRAVKNGLVADIANYSSEECRTYYKARGIPYRRGYLLYGPPGTGKTSLCVALASHFSVDLYIIHLPSIETDSDLRGYFKMLPGKCFVVLEDIDAVGLNQRGSKPSMPKDGCTLSGLLNVLDGVGSHEGRIILMTTNFIERLDAALVRPGRIDKQVYLGKLQQPAAKEMFLRMF
ncbi:P-loop containing nucleoside triphosphate hydrolase protein, partial [Xylariaceae sp. AK1471]